LFEILGGIIVLTIMVVLSGIKVVKEHDRLVVFRCGKAVAEKGPGFQLILPIIDKAQVVDTRIVTLPIQLIEAMTSDNMSIKVSALCMYQIVDAKRAVTKVENVAKAAKELAEGALRTAVGNNDLRHLVSDRKRVNFNLKNILDRQTKDFGIRIYKIELKEVRVSREIRKALAKRNLQIDRAANGNGGSTELKLATELHADMINRLS
jgi:regulator of protease activity HflC (stomatin/prohibitin superfamily)